MRTPSLAFQAWRTGLARVSSPPHSSLPLFLSVSKTQRCPLKLFSTLSLVVPVSPPLNTPFLSLSLSSLLSVLFLPTLPCPGPVENVNGGQPSWWLSGFGHHEWVRCAAHGGSGSFRGPRVKLRTSPGRCSEIELLTLSLSFSFNHPFVCWSLFLSVSVSAVWTCLKKLTLFSSLHMC